MLNLDLHTKANNFAPNEYREVVNLSGLAVCKGSNTRVEIVVATERKVKAVNWSGVNYDGNMDRDPMISQVMSLSQKTKATMLGDQITARQLTEL